MDEQALNSLEYNLMMFSEHTWGYFTSVSEPWNKMTQKLEDRNRLFASKASEIADTLIDDITFSEGELAKAAGRPMRYKVQNPYPHALSTPVLLYINWWEEFLIEDGYDLVDQASGQSLDFQELLVDEKKRREVNTYLQLSPFETRTLDIVPTRRRKREVPLGPLHTRGGVYDYTPIHLDTTVYATQYHIDTPFFHIAWSHTGIHTVQDKESGKNLKSTHEEGLFLPIYERTPIEYTYQFNVEKMQAVRKEFGRNRKLISTVRDRGELINVRVMNNGPNIARVQFKYRLEGTRYCVVELKTSRDAPRIDVALILQKETVWEPESLYLAMPLTAGGDETLFIDKAGAVIRPRIDQLPGTQSLFYTTQSGYTLKGEALNIHVNLKDTPLLHLGTLEPGLAKIHDGSLPNVDSQYVWAMNNYWETNFATSLGGFYRFDYSIGLSHENEDGRTLMERTAALEKTPLVYQVGYHEKT